MSTTQAIYYSDSRLYALVWGAYRIPPSEWQTSLWQGAVIFEASLKLTSQNLDEIYLPNSHGVQAVRSPLFHRLC